MKNVTKVTRVSTVEGDWGALYFDGEKVGEGHSIPLREVFAALGVKFETREVDDDWAEMNCPFPERLKDIP